MAPQPTVPSADDAPAAQPLEPQRTRSSSYALSRRSTAERINAILETGRERAQRASTSSNPPENSMPTRPSGTRPSPLDQPNGDHDESSADERTGIVSRGDRVSYQSTATRERLRPGNGVRHPEAAQRREPEVEGHKARRGPWHAALFAPFKSIELENKGSVARDHLAIERTFLAWLRTSLAFASIGIAVTQLFRLNTSLTDDSQSRTLRQLGKPLGATFLGISIVILCFGYRRFVESQRWVIEGKFPASRGIILLVSFMAFALTVASLAVVVIVHPREREL